MLGLVVFVGRQHERGDDQAEDAQDDDHHGHGALAGLGLGVEGLAGAFGPSAHRDEEDTEAQQEPEEDDDDEHAPRKISVGAPERPTGGARGGSAQPAAGPRERLPTFMAAEAPALLCVVDRQTPRKRVPAVNILRRLPLSRLLLLCGAIVVAGISVTAIASAVGSGPTPPAKPLAEAVHDALGAPAVQGVTANIKLTNHLLEGANLAGSGQGGELASSPLINGGSGRLWISSDGKIRLELQAEKGDTQVISDGNSVSIYDAASNTLYRYTPPASTATGMKAHPHGLRHPPARDRRADPGRDHEDLGAREPLRRPADGRRRPRRIHRARSRRRKAEA